MYILSRICNPLFPLSPDFPPPSQISPGPRHNGWPKNAKRLPKRLPNWGDRVTPSDSSEKTTAFMCLGEKRF